MKFFNNGWDEVLEDEFEKPYFKTLLDKVDEEYENHNVYPPRGKVFSALTHCDIKNVKVVILGQDPYHEEGQAHGMCFSVMPGVAIPPSLKNIYKEIEAEYGFVPPNHGYLVSWSNQGVLLLNTTLTVREHEANSHSTYGWQKFTDRIIQEVNKQGFELLEHTSENAETQEEKFEEDLPDGGTEECGGIIQEKPKESKNI